MEARQIMAPSVGDLETLIPSLRDTRARPEAIGRRRRERRTIALHVRVVGGTTPPRGEGDARTR
jgi:hypothetical protein